jgi:hypothetical protein
MFLTNHYRALLRGMLAGAVALAGISACSRSDRADIGRDTTQVGEAGTAATPDTQMSLAPQPAATDTAAVAVGDTGKKGVETATPTPRADARETRSDTINLDTASAEMANAAVDTTVSAHADTMTQHALADTAAGQETGADTTVAGYVPMARDTSTALAQEDTATQAQTDLAVKDQPDTVTVVGDSSSVDKPGPRAKEDTVSQKADSLGKYHEAERVRPPEDSTETLGQMTTDSAELTAADTAADAGAIPDTTAYGYEPMARDTSVALAQGDTVGPAQSDTAVKTQPDTAAIQVQVDTTAEAQTELAVEDQPDTVTVVGDSSSIDKPAPRAKEDTVSQKADSLAQYHEAERVRPPEDSTEVLGNVNPDQAEAKAEAEAEADVEAVGDANAEAVGAAQIQPTGKMATGVAAVSLMTREGERCTVMDPEKSPEVRWDMASSPAALNPCGTGTMTLPKIWTGEKE